MNSGGTLVPPAALPLAATFREFELGDWNADGMLDLIVLLDYPASPSVMLGPLNPSPLDIIPIGAPDDASCMAIGDANGDAVRDLAIGPSGNLMQVFLAPPAGIQSLGAIATANIKIPEIAGGNSAHGPPAAGDLDGNGRIDFVTPDPTNSTVTFLRNTAPQPIGVASYGNSSAGCAGLEGLAAGSTPKLGNSQFRIIATQSPPSSLGLLLLADAQDAAGSNALGLGIQLHVDPLASTVLLGRDLRSDPTGYAVAEVPVPSTPALAGAIYFAQGLFAWSGSCPLGPFGLSSTSALVIAVQP